MRHRFRILTFGFLAVLLCAVSGWLAIPVLASDPVTDATAVANCVAATEPDATPDGDGMVAIPGGTFVMGSETFHPEEMPLRSATVGPFLIDRHEVTNAQFAAFVDATGYVTVAERPLDPADYPGVDESLLVPGSMVFVMPERVADMEDLSQWWRYVAGANWRHPEGPDSTIEGRKNYPVVHVTREDALAYARWLGRDLPTEAEWEFAARGGLDRAEYVWGDEAVPDDAWQTNAWQGMFPIVNFVDDGFAGAAPVGCFAPNGYGLFDMAGNVWELTRDDYADRRGPQPGMGVIKGGSFLCADNFCFRYRPAARQPAALDTGASHTGFRTVLRSSTG